MVGQKRSSLLVAIGVCYHRMATWKGFRESKAMLSFSPGRRKYTLWFTLPQMSTALIESSTVSKTRSHAIHDSLRGTNSTAWLPSSKTLPSSKDQASTTSRSIYYSQANAEDKADSQRY